MKIMKLPILLSIFLSVSILMAACSDSAPSPQQPTAAPPAAQNSAAASLSAPDNTSVKPTGKQTAAPAPNAPLSYANPQEYSVIYTVTIMNTGFTPTDIQLYLPVPGEWEAQKDLGIVEISPEPKAQMQEKTKGNSMVFWRLTSIPAKDTSADLKLSFTFTAYETLIAIDPSSVQPYKKDSPEVARYTKAEKYIESDDPSVVKLAGTLSGTETNPYLLAKKFYDYIIDTEKYKVLNQGLNGAKYLLENGNGECGDYSALFAALCRAKGIPARPVVGYWAVSGNDQTHVWAEFYLEGIGWIPEDATIGQQSEENRLYYFGNMDNRRVILSKGFNTLLEPETSDHFAAPILQMPLWWFWGSGSADKLTMTSAWSVEKVN